MKTPKVLLVYPPNQLMTNEKPRTDGSLGPLYLVGALARAGIEADVLDASVGTLDDNLESTLYRRVMQSNGLVRVGMSVDRIKEVIARGVYNIVGVHSNFTPQTHMALEVATAAKAVSPEILVIAGGVNARALSDKFLADSVDIVCNTEGERVIVKIARTWEKGGNFDEVTGTVRMRSGQLVEGKSQSGVNTLLLRRNPQSGLDTLDNLDGLPMPAWHKLPFEHYDRAVAAGRNFQKEPERSAPMMTSRGCPFDCDFCHISEEKQYTEDSGDIGRLRLKSEERVMMELEILKSLGVKKVRFEDDSFLAKKSRVKRILAELPKMGLRFEDANGVNLAHFVTKVGGKLVIDEEYLELLAGAGFTTIVFPVESASQRILDKYATGKLDHNNLDVVELVKVATRLGITCPINMMMGFPDETEEEIMASIELGRRLVGAGARYCSFKTVVPFPGSRLYDDALRQGYLPQDFDPDDFNWRRAIMKNTTVPPERIEYLQQWADRDVNTDEHYMQELDLQIGDRYVQSGETR